MHCLHLLTPSLHRHKSRTQSSIVDHRITTTTVIIALLLLLTSTSTALECKNCRNIDGTIRCERDCIGDMCILWKWTDHESVDHLLQGCIVGLSKETGVRVGCRRNAANAQLCICESVDRCNQVDQIGILPTISMPNVLCRQYTEAPYISPQSKDTTCRANYCYYTQTKVTNHAGDDEWHTTAGCGQLPQYTFDVQIATVWPGPGLVAGSCYRLQANGNDTTLGCMCANGDGCNLVQPFKIVDKVASSMVRCHLAYGIDNDAMEDDGDGGDCIGHVCVLQRTEIPQYGVQFMKGCLSASDGGNLHIGYRNLLGVEMWLCADDYCNRDMQTAQLKIAGSSMTITLTPPKAMPDGVSDGASFIPNSLLTTTSVVVLLRVLLFIFV